MNNESKIQKLKNEIAMIKEFIKDLNPSSSAEWTMFNDYMSIALNKAGEIYKLGGSI